MAIWQWALIDAGILVLGGLWLSSVVISMAKSAKTLISENSKLLEQVQALEAATSERSSYEAPKDNLQDSAFEKTAIFLKRLRVQEQKREAKKRRLIARFSTRK
jgi:hypothetical protein